MNMKTTTNNKMNEKFASGMTFADILAESLSEVLNETAKKMEQEIRMLHKIDKSVEEMHEEAKAHGDAVLGTVEIHECPCPKNCGSVKVELDFIALTFLPNGMKLKHRKIERVIVNE